MDSSNGLKWAATTLLASVVFLWVLGLQVQDSVEMEMELPGAFRRQLYFGGTGFACLLLAMVRDYQKWQKPWWVYGLLGLSLFLLVAVMFQPATAKINGARRWFLGLGQPSELAKLGLLLAAAYYYSRHRPLVEDHGAGFMKPGLVLFILAFWIAIEPDWGTAVLIVAVGGVMTFCAGVRWKYLLCAVGTLALLLAIGIWLDDLRRERWLAFLHPWDYRFTVAWQTCNTMVAMAMGGLWGRGPGQGRFKGGYVPEQSTDFVLSAVGEEWGLLGTGLVLLAFVAILISGVFIASRAVNPFARLLAIGITSLISMQALIHFGVATSLLPNKGISLPFVSYGGSNLLVMMTSIGLLLSIARVAASARQESRESAGNPFSETNE